MKLQSLYCTNNKFKTLVFKPALNIVKSIQLTEEEKKTYNGIGKSLSLSLINLMLGGKTDPNNSFIKYLSSYGVFTLKFVHNKNEYSVVKDFSKTEYILNGESYSYRKYLSELDKIFRLVESKIKFRNLFKAFVRVFGGTYYVDALTQQGMPISDYNQRLINFILLGLDVDIVEQKYKLKNQIETLSEAEKTVAEYEEELGKTNIKDKKDELELLKEKKKQFIIAENYNELKRKADQLTQQLNEIRNITFTNELAIKRKEEELEYSVNIDVDIEAIRQIYNEAKYFFPDMIYKKLKEVKIFHKTIITNRKNRIEKELNSLMEVNQINIVKMESIAQERDKIIELLDNSGALEEYYSLLDSVKHLETEIAEAEKYKNIINSFKLDKVKLNIKNSEIQEQSLKWLQMHSGEIEEKEAIFRSIVKKFYTNSGGSLDLVETKDAKYLFDIKLEIPKEKSQGVGLVKIFAYDVMLFILNTNKLGFMAHDGCLFSEMDPRQKAMIIKSIIELNKKYDLQYFINMNENTYMEILNSSIFSDEEREVIEKSVILSLSDKPPKGFLFGESF